MWTGGFLFPPDKFFEADAVVAEEIGPVFLHVDTQLPTCDP